MLLHRLETGPLYNGEEEEEEEEEECKADDETNRSAGRSVT